MSKKYMPYGIKPNSADRATYDFRQDFTQINSQIQLSCSKTFLTNTNLQVKFQVYAFSPNIAFVQIGTLSHVIIK